MNANQSFSSRQGLSIRRAAFCLLALIQVSMVGELFAYPPAPHHTIYGLVRDDYGTPIMSSDVRIIFQTASGVQFVASCVPGLGAGINYQVEVPMDAGVTPDAYQASALQPAVRFRMFVVVNQVTNLPIQMTGDFSKLGQPGQSTRIDLTLGTDSNGDGLPDAWELAYLASIGSSLTLADLTPSNDLRQQFLVGTFPFGNTEPFTVKLVDLNRGAPVLEFTAVTGRSYTVLGSSDLLDWQPVQITVPAEGPSAGTRAYYFSQDIRTVQVQVVPSAGPAAAQFFKLMLQ